MKSMRTGLFWKRGAAAAAAGTLLLAAATLSAQIQDRGEIFEIRSFRPVRLTTDQAITNWDGTELTSGMELDFRIRARGDFENVRYFVTLYDTDMNPIPRPISRVVYNFKRRQTEGKHSSFLERESRPDSFRVGRTYSFAFFTNESFRYALVEVGNRDEKVYAVYPRGTSLEELLARK